MYFGVANFGEHTRCVFLTTLSMSPAGDTDQHWLIILNANQWATRITPACVATTQSSADHCLGIAIFEPPSNCATLLTLMIAQNCQANLIDVKKLISIELILYLFER